MFMCDFWMVCVFVIYFFFGRYSLTNLHKKQMKWVLSDGNGSYVIGQFDGTRFHTEQEKTALDYGFNFYATQTWNDVPKEEGRCIQMAWMRGGKYPDMPFNQQHTFPCVLSLRTVGDAIRLCRELQRDRCNLLI